MSTTLTIENEIPRFLNDLFHIFIGHCSQKWEPQAQKMSCLKKKVGESLDRLGISGVKFSIKRAN